MIIILSFFLDSREMHGPGFVFQLAPVAFDLWSLERRSEHAEARMSVLQDGGILCDIEKCLANNASISTFGAWLGSKYFVRELYRPLMTEAGSYGTISFAIQGTARDRKQIALLICLWKTSYLVSS